MKGRTTEVMTHTKEQKKLGISSKELVLCPWLHFMVASQHRSIFIAHPVVPHRLLLIMSLLPLLLAPLIPLLPLPIALQDLLIILFLMLNPFSLMINLSSIHHFLSFSLDTAPECIPQCKYLLID